MSQNSKQRAEYIARINRVLDYIDNHLDRELSLTSLAEVACFSPFHFHRIFRAMMGEPLNVFIKRLRLERAAAQLCNLPDKPITDIALDTGFSGSAAFARAFRDFFGMSASQWRETKTEADSKIGKTDSNVGLILGNRRQAASTASVYVEATTPFQQWRLKMSEKLEAKVVVKSLPLRHVAYVRHVGPYKGDEALFGELFGRLMKWAMPRGILQQPNLECLVIYHDDPNVTEETKLRTSVCFTVPPDTEVSGEIGKMTIPAADYAMAHFEIATDQFEDAWNAVCGEWLPESGYQPADGPTYELCLNNPDEHPEHKHIVEICIPVKPL